MENMNGLNNFAFTAKNRNGMPLSPLSLLMDSPSSDSNDSSPFEPKGNIKSIQGLNHHQRCSSESFIFDDQPSWLDDLLNDSEIFNHKGHRRSASDSYAYLGEASTTFNTREESKFLKAYINTDENNNQETEELAVEKNREESSPQTLEGSSSKANGSQAKQSASKTDTKRAKQHNAHRSRVRKLQYISHLERTVQMLQIEGSEVSAELQFIEQQNIILSMENRALKQRLESISQEQIIKHWEQEMLEREIGRLQTLHHIQKQQQQQLQVQQPHHPKQRRSRSKDFDQVNNCAMKNKEPISTNDSVTASIRA